MKVKNPAAQALGRLRAKHFETMPPEEKSKFFRELRLKRKDLQPKSDTEVAS